MSNISRRSFLQKGTAAAAALTIVPSAVLGKTHGHIAPTDKLNKEHGDYREYRSSL